MSIKIIDEPEIRLTRGQHDRLMREWKRSCQYTTEPPTFEDFVRSQIARGHVDRSDLNGDDNARSG